MNRTLRKSRILLFPGTTTHRKGNLTDSCPQRVEPNEWRAVVQFSIRVWKNWICQSTSEGGSKGVTYASSHLNKMDSGGKEISTNTWVLEDNKLRRLILPKTTEEVKKAFNNEIILPQRPRRRSGYLRPFSVDAYKSSLLVSKGPGFVHPRAATGHWVTLCRAVLSINENDSTVLFLAVCLTEDPILRRPSWSAMEGHGIYTDAAHNVAIKYIEPNERLSFLESQKNVPHLLMLKLLALGQLKHWGDFKKLSNEKDTFTSIKKP